MQSTSNIKHIKEYGSPARASQRGVVECSGRLMTFPCDDGIFLPNALDSAIDLHNAVAGPKDGLVMRYREAAGMKGASFPPEYWNANYHLRGLQLEPHWKIAPQPMMSTKYFREIGGVDCLTFQAMAFCSHDLSYRVQRDGGVFHLSPLEVMNADNYGEVGVDHEPIFTAQTSADHPAFIRMYSDPAVRNRIKIDFDNWKSSPEIWSYRWAGKELP